MRLEGRNPQVTPFQTSNTVSDVGQAAKPQNAGAAQAASNSPLLAKDQFGAAKNAAPEYTNQARTGLQVPDTLRRPDRSGGGAEVGPKIYPCITDMEPPTRSGGGAEVGPKIYPCSTEPGGIPLGHPDKPVIGEKVRVGEKVYPTAVGAAGKTPLGGQAEPVIGQEVGPKPGFVGCETEPVIGEKLGPKPGFVCETEPPVIGELRPKPGFEGFDEKPVTLTKLDPKPGAKPTGREPDVYYGKKSTSSDTEIKVPEPERKPDTSPWGKPIAEPKNPDMWNDDLGQRNR